MTMAMRAAQSRATGPKVLRVGVIQGGKIIEERIVRKRETVKVGSSEKNHFVVQADGLRAQFELFQLVGNDYILNFTKEMKGKVGLAGGVKDLEKLRSGGGARNAGTHWQVKLTDNSRGKIIIGNTTLLFQFVVPPPVQPRPQLPAAVVGGFAAGIDWLFTAFVMFSFMSHFGFIIYLENADWPIQPNVATVPDYVAEMIFNEPEEPPDETPVEDNGEPTDEATDEVAEADTTQESSSSSESASDDRPSTSEAQAQANSDARMAVEEATANVDQMIMGALGGESGALANVLAGGAVTGNAADVLAQAEGVGVASTTGGGTLRERGGGGRLNRGQEGLGALNQTSGSAQQEREEGTQIVERTIRGRATVGSLDDESGSGDFDPSAVTRMIRTRIRAIQACYERQLRQNPTLAGRVLVQFTIQPSGSVSGARVLENSTGSDAVGTCVTGAVGRFRFNPGPEGGSVTYSYPFVFAPQN